MSKALKSRRQMWSKNYGYCNARLHGMRSHLLKPDFFDQLMDAADMNRIIQLLSETEYSQDLDAEMIHGRTADTVDEALKDNIVRAFQKVMGFLNPEGSDIIGTLVGRWDLFNIKSIIRGKHVHLASEEIERSLYAVGQFTPIELKDLARHSDVRAVVDTLATWGSPYAKALRQAMPDYIANNDLAVLEFALDRYYSAWSAEQLAGKGANRKLALRILGIQIDSINLLTAFRLLRSDIGDMDPMRLFLPGGAHIAKEQFVELAQMSDIDQVLDALKATAYGNSLDEAAAAYVEVGSISVFERALEEYAMRKALSAGQADSVGVGIGISYLWAKQNEVTNLRIIVKGKTVRMPVDRMKRELILV